MTTSKHAKPVFLALATVSLCFFLPDISSCAEESPAIDPPTAETVSEYPFVQESSQTEITALTPTIEWLYHKTSDNMHPNGIEQRQLWFINRARSNPTNEGVWLATESHSDVAGGRDYFNVDINKLQTEFAAISPMPPAAFDRRLYEAARVHSEDLIARDAQDHTGQFDRVNDAGFSWSSLGGVVFSYTKTGLHAHAGFNIDWGNEPDGMQTGRGHRVALMSDGKEYTNVGISSISVTDTSKDVGPYVTTGNYAKANHTVANHFNNFVVGTVWNDTNSNGWYDIGEGLANVTVMPSIGTYYAVTAASGGYAIPITEIGAATLTFSGGTLPGSGSVDTTLSTVSKLVDFTPGMIPAVENDFPWNMFLPAIISSKKSTTIDCNGDVGGTAYLDNCNTCVGGNTGQTPCTQDCNGVWGGTAVLDSCGVCDGDDSTCSAFQRNSSGYIVTDTTTDLMWQDSTLAFEEQAEGITYCEDKILDGFNDWRLPTLAELQYFFRGVAADPDFDLDYWGTTSTCTASVAIGGYVKTPAGAQRYGGATGDIIYFSGGAAARCVR